MYAVFLIYLSYLIYLPLFNMVPNKMMGLHILSELLLKITMYVFIQPVNMSRMQHKVILKCSLTGFEIRVLFLGWLPYTKVKEPSLLDYLPIAGGKIIGFIPFLRSLVLC